MSVAYSGEILTPVSFSDLENQAEFFALTVSEIITSEVGGLIARRQKYRPHFIPVTIYGNRDIYSSKGKEGSQTLTITAPHVYDPGEPLGFFMDIVRRTRGKSRPHIIRHEVAFSDGELRRCKPEGIPLSSKRIGNLHNALRYNLDADNLIVRAHLAEAVPCPHPEFDATKPGVLSRVAQFMHRGTPIPDNQAILL